MNYVSRNCLKMVLTAVLAVYPNLATWRTAQAAETPEAPSGVFAKPGTLEGTALTSDLDPVVGVELKVIDADGNVLASAVTDENGKFSLPDLNSGQYRLLVGEDIELNLTVSETSMVTNLRMVLPEGAKVGAAGVAAAGGGLSFIQIGAIGLAVVGGGFGVAYAVDDDDDGHD